MKSPEVPPPVVTWNGEPIRVSATLRPRYLWQSATIDVAVGDKCILRTGGVLRFWGSVEAAFAHAGLAHVARLSWKTSGILRDFPYTLSIDGVQIVAGLVRPQNFVPVARGTAAAVAAALALYFVISGFLHR